MSNHSTFQKPSPTPDKLRTAGLVLLLSSACLLFEQRHEFDNTADKFQPYNALSKNRPMYSMPLPVQSAPVLEAKYSSMLRQPTALRSPEFDIQTATVDISARRVRSLAVGDELLLPTPSGATLPLRVQRIEQRQSFRIINLSSGGLTSTLTLRGNHYFGTFASTSEAYSFEGNLDHGEYLSHRQLNYRWLTEVKDFRHAPLG